MTGGKRKPKDEARSFEAALAELESIIDRIESGEIGLEASLEEYQKGVGLIKRCRAVLDAAEQRVEQLAEELDGPGDGNGPGGLPA